MNIKELAEQVLTRQKNERDRERSREHFREHLCSQRSQPREHAPDSRFFLSRPLTQETNLNPWDAWAPFLDWLCVHYPARLHGILDAEDAIEELERSGIVEGEEYEAACSELFWQFEEARRLKMREGVRVWIQ